MYPIYPPYQSPTYAQIPQVPQATQPQAFQIPYVNDKKSAEAYQMPVNSSIILMDATMPRFYLKQTDASGAVTLKAYDFKEVDDKPVEYVTKAEFESFKQKMKGANRNESANDARKQQ